MTPLLGIALALGALCAVFAVQVLLTSPGVMTFAEYRLLLLCATPTAVYSLTANWIDEGRRDDEW